jgi:para-aminobenzoate synthetase
MQIYAGSSRPNGFKVCMGLDTDGAGGHSSVVKTVVWAAVQKFIFRHDQGQIEFVITSQISPYLTNRPPCSYSLAPSDVQITARHYRPYSTKNFRPKRKLSNITSAVFARIQSAPVTVAGRSSARHMQDARLLFIDAYDSFSNSIIALLQRELSVTVESIKIDDARFVLNDEAFSDFLDGFDAVVAGPGPGHPSNVSDIGLIRKLWSQPPDHIIPVLGICLGFQSLCLAHGASVVRLHEPRHGIVTTISHGGQDIFAKADEVIATQYHSLHVRLHDGRDENAGPGSKRDMWAPSRGGTLIPLAWDCTDSSNGDVLMAVRHSTRPYWGLQYHPESICTNSEGHSIIRNWWAIAWEFRSGQSRRDSGLSLRLPGPLLRTDASDVVPRGDDLNPRHVSWSALQPANSLDVADFVEQLQARCLCNEPIVLESGLRNARPLNAETGRFSIICCPEPSSTQLCYATSDGTLTILRDGIPSRRTNSCIDDAFEQIGEHTKAHLSTYGCPDVPFWGGFVGYVSYESGLETIDVSPPLAAQGRPDFWFVFVERSIVLDHCSGTVFVQSTKACDGKWLDSVKECVNGANRKSQDPRPMQMEMRQSGGITIGPQQSQYCQKVSECQEQLRAGESYELCLTDQTVVENSNSPWMLYRQLRKQNPAPFGAYLRLSSSDQVGVSLLSSSPERFLSWSRSGKCQFRPIKGTVRKSPTTTRLQAETILKSAKEQAENLMIVDLIRHDLSGVKG